MTGSEHAKEWADLCKRAHRDGWTKEVAAEWGRLKALTGKSGTLSNYEAKTARLNEVIPAPSLMSPDERRNYVLQYPDLADKLRDCPLGLKDPQKWNGFIPPQYDHSAANGVSQLNTSPIRAQLVALVGEAIRRYHTPSAAIETRKESA
jgi:hypothetical protein